MSTALRLVLTRRPSPTALRLSAGLLGLLLSACSGPSTVGQRRMDDLASELADVADGLEGWKLQFQEALDAHGLLVANADNDPGKNFDRLADSIDDCVETQAELERATAAIETSASTYFSGWEADNESISDPLLRELGEDRRGTALQRLDRIRTQLAELHELQQPLIELLHDHITFLSNDLNLEATSSLTTGSDTLYDAADALCTMFDQAAADLRATAQTLSMRPAG